MYEYRAIVTKVYDGDTITVDIDLGLGVWVRGEKIRLYGIDAPELRGEEREAGLVARDYLRELVLGKEVTLHTYKDKKGKYGRYLAHVEMPVEDDFLCGDCRTVNAKMVDAGHAAWREY